MGKVVWKSPIWKPTPSGEIEAVIGKDGDLRFTVQLTQKDGAWYSSFGGEIDRPSSRLSEGPFDTMEEAKKHWARSHTRSGA